MTKSQTALTIILCGAVSLFAEDARLPPKALELRQGYEAAIRRALSPLTATYVAELERMKVAATQSADLQTALALANEIQRVTTEESARQLSAAAAKAPKDNPDAALFQGRWYKFFRERSSFEEARLICEKNGGHLAFITSSEIDTFVLHLIAGEPAWFGASLQDGPDDWRWLNGKSLRYTNWNVGQPERDDHQPYPVINLFGNKKWDDCLIGDKYGFVCEWDE
jgi:hypothetical protein